MSTPAGPLPRLRTALRSSGHTLRSRILRSLSRARNAVQGTSVVDVARGVFGSTLLQIAGVIAIGVVATAFVVTIGPSGNPAAPSPTFTPSVSGPLLRKLQGRDALAIAFCREVATLHTSPRRTSAQWRRYFGIQAFLASDGRRLDRDRLFGAALAAAQDDSAKQSAYERGCTRAGLPPE